MARREAHPQHQRRAMSPEEHAGRIKALNAHARQMIKKHALPRRFPIASLIVAGGGTITAQNNTVNIAPQNVGLLTRFIIKGSVKYTNSDDSDAATLTNLGLANVVSRFQFTDLQNNVRISTPGWHIAMMNAVRDRRVHAAVNPVIDAAGGLDTGVGSMGSFGNNWPNVIQGPTGGVIDHGDNSTSYFEYELPIAYSKEDLTGVIYMNVVNATAQLQIQFNYAPGVGAAADPSAAVFQGTASVAASEINLTIYQEYFDQLPNWGEGAKRQPILPPVDVGTIYGIYDTTLTGVQQNQDFPMPFANYRDFLATYMLLNNQTGGSYPTAGSDVNYFKLSTANFTDVWKQDPYLTAKDTRDEIGTDLPVPIYYFASRKRPIATTQQGNMQLVANLSTANTGAYAWLAYEYFARINTITGAASLPGT